MSNSGLEDVGREGFHVLEECLQVEKRRKPQTQSYGYYYGKRHYSVAKPVQSNPQPKRQSVIIDSSEAAKKYGGVVIVSNPVPNKEQPRPRNLPRKLFRWGF